LVERDVTINSLRFVDRHIALDQSVTSMAL